ncbi:MAG: hypothetical protein H0T89_20145 [Deltaproteobacteria bacterium]|nr:hypothetical protein [Deltaproteobacteria bacterium]MDQ3298429.1 hypothetical protein [Myxococcota bacterium]
MRPLITLVSLTLFTPAAFADRTPAQRSAAPAPTAAAPVAAPAPPSNGLASIDLLTIPEKCHPMVKQATTPNRMLALSARITLANCVAEAKLATLQLVDAQDSVQAVDDATAHSFAILDEVIGNADAVTKIVAEQAKAELYTNMAIRMLASVPAPGAGEAASALHQTRKDLLVGMLAPWRDKAAASYEHIVAIANADPKLVKNPVVATALRTSKDRLRARTATAAAQPPPAVAPTPAEAPAAASDGDQLR